MNIPEVLVANCTGATIAIFVFLLRVRNSETKQLGAWLYDGILAAVLAAQVTETISFLIDGQMFPGARALQYFTNTVCSGASVFVGFAWCLFVDFRLYRSTRRLRKMFFRLGIPFLIVLLLLVVNLFGTGLLFRISDENVYSRGSLNFLFYALLTVYYSESIALVYRAKRSGISVEFFPVLYFVLPCVVGTIVQGLFYGIAIGWLSVSVAFVFIHLQLQNFNTFVDELSGLFNRKYMNYRLEKARKAHSSDFYGIMMDVNNFKAINDRFGHSVGDRAIQEIGRVLSSSLPENAVAIRMAGDEFIVLLDHGSNRLLAETIAAINQNLQRFNQTTTAPFQLSLAIGSAKYDGRRIEGFLNELDRNMYADKKRYHAEHPPSEGVTP